VGWDCELDEGDTGVGAVVGAVEPALDAVLGELGVVEGAGGGEEVMGGAGEGGLELGGAVLAWDVGGLLTPEFEGVASSAIEFERLLRLSLDSDIFALGTVGGQCKRVWGYQVQWYHRQQRIASNDGG
jgi:hypothetical protein